MVIGHQHWLTNNQLFNNYSSSHYPSTHPPALPRPPRPFSRESTNNLTGDSVESSKNGVLSIEFMYEFIHN